MSRSPKTSEQKLQEKLFKVRKEARAVPKKGDNSSGNFNFAKYEDVLAEASRLLDAQRILVTPRVVSEKVAFSQSRPLAVATVVMEFVVEDLSSGGAQTFRWSGTGDDEPGGKALFKAQTGCEKSFLKSLCRIPYGDDPETEEKDGSEQQTTELHIPPEEEDGDRVRAEQDRAAEAPQVPPRRSRPLPESNLPEPDWSGLREDAEEVGAGV